MYFFLKYLGGRVMGDLWKYEITTNDWYCLSTEVQRNDAFSRYVVSFIIKLKIYNYNYIILF